MHARTSGHANMNPPIPTPPDTAEGFARMSGEQRSDLYRRDVALYRQFAAAELADVNAGTGPTR